MNTSDLRQKLISAGRHRPPGDHVPYAFEQRVMARIRSLSPVSVWSVWGRSLWMAALSCVAVTLLCGVWSFTSLPSSDNDLLSQDELENVVCASIDPHSEEIW
jgi:hypothetical protein